MKLQQKLFHSKYIYTYLISIFSSLDIFSNKDKLKEIKESEGKSGSFFFFTHDKKFIIKTLHQHELQTILGGFLKSYHELIVDSEATTLLARIYGIFEIVIQ